MQYSIKHAATPPALAGKWDDAPWQGAETGSLANFFERSSSHRPKVEFRLLWDRAGLYVFFRVEDRYVRCLRTDYQNQVCKDSCVEFFVEPKPGAGYLNFEVNCGGNLLLYFLDYPDPAKGGIKMKEVVPRSLGETVKIYHSMPKVVYPELDFDVTWKIEYFAPFSLFEHYFGPLGEIGGQTWRANFYKCADESSHPHWATWAPLPPKVSFHVPQHFAPIKFLPAGA
ncbi:MAG: carbohydrate-binding family 9-like protein [Kiritimatiellia bacterium]